LQRSIPDEFVRRLVDFSKTLRLGNGLDPDVQLGPLISGKQLDKVMNYVKIGEKEGAQLAGGGQRLGGDHAKGYFIELTVFGQVK